RSEVDVVLRRQHRARAGREAQSYHRAPARARGHDLEDIARTTNGANTGVRLPRVKIAIREPEILEGNGLHTEGWVRIRAAPYLLRMPESPYTSAGVSGAVLRARPRLVRGASSTIRKLPSTQLINPAHLGTSRS